MKVLFLSQGRTIDDQIGYHLAWQNAVSNGKRIELVDIPWIGFAEEHGCVALWDEIRRVNKEFCPDLVFFQRFHSPIESPAQCIEDLKKAPNSPLIFGDLGDLFQPSIFKPWRRPIPSALKDVIRMSDVFFSTSMGALADHLIALGARRVCLLPLAFSNYHFPDWNASLPKECDFDVLVVGSIPHIRKRCPISSINQIRARKRMAAILYKRYGKRFGLFGYGWNGHPAWRGTVPFKEQIRLFKTSRVCVDAKPPYPNMYYGSNRPFYIAGSGSMLVQYHTPRFEKMLESGVNSNYIKGDEELISRCDELLSLDDSERRQRGVETMDVIQNHHTVDKRVDTIISYFEVLRESPEISTIELFERTRNWHFLDWVNRSEESEFAVRDQMWISKGEKPCTMQ